MLTRRSWSVRLAFYMALGCMSAFAQTTYSYVSSQYPMGSLTLGGAKFSVTLGVTYPTTLSPGSYISGTQLAGDMQGFLAGYPNQSDPAEAILSSALNSVLQKYSQMAGGTLIASVSPTISPTGTVTLGATIEVVIGSLNIFGVPVASRSPAPSATRIVQPLIRPAPQESKTGN